MRKNVLLLLNLLWATAGARLKKKDYNKYACSVCATFLDVMQIEVYRTIEREGDHEIQSTWRVDGKTWVSKARSEYELLQKADHALEFFSWGVDASEQADGRVRLHQDDPDKGRSDMGRGAASTAWRTLERMMGAHQDEIILLLHKNSPNLYVEACVEVAKVCPSKDRTLELRGVHSGADNKRDKFRKWWGELACTRTYPGDPMCYESDEAAAAAGLEAEAAAAAGLEAKTEL